MKMTVRNAIWAFSIIAAAYIGTTVLYLAIRFGANHQRCEEALIQPSDPRCPEQATSTGQ